MADQKTEAAEAIEKEFTKALERLVDFAKLKGIKAVIIAGPSGKVAGIAFRHAWKTRFQEEPPIVYRFGDFFDKQRVVDISPPDYPRWKKVLANIPGLYKSLNTGEPVLLLDEVADTGNSLKRTRDNLGKLGFGNLCMASIVGGSRGVMKTSNMPEWSHAAIFIGSHNIPLAHKLILKRGAMLNLEKIYRNRGKRLRLTAPDFLPRLRKIYSLARQAGRRTTPIRKMA